MSTHSRNTILLATDQQRSVLSALDAHGLHPIAYTAYGHRPAENGLLSLLGFNGEPPDPLTGRYHLGNGYRQFNPILMRFNSPDSWSPFGAGGLNAYAYCDGEPINQSDPTGHASLKWLNPLNWRKSSKPKSGLARTKSDMVKDIIQTYNKPDPQLPTTHFITTNHNNVYAQTVKRRYTIINQFAKQDKNKLKLHSTIEYNGYTLKTEQSITIHKNLDKHSLGKPKIYNTKDNEPFNPHNKYVAEYANLIIRSKPLSMNKFDKITKKSTGMLLSNLNNF